MEYLMEWSISWSGSSVLASRVESIALVVESIALVVESTCNDVEHKSTCTKESYYVMEYRE